MKTRILICLGLAAGLLVAGCSDGDGPTGPADANEAPIASASASATTVLIGATVQLDGSGSSDPDQDTLTFVWHLATPRGSDASLSGATDTAPTFVADVSGAYVATLTVSDGEAEASDTVTIDCGDCTPTLVDTDIVAATTFPDVCLDTELPDYIVQGTPSVAAELVIEPGVVIAFAEEAGLRVVDGGAILAQGTAEAPIRLRGQQAQPGFWRGLFFDADAPTSALSHVHGQHGGHAWDAADEAATIVVGNDASVSLASVSVAESAGHGIFVEPRGELSGFDAVGITTSEDAPLLIPDVQMGALDGPATLVGNGRDHVAVYRTGGIASPVDVPDPGVPYRLDGFFEVDAQVTLAAGVTLEFERDAAVRVNDGGALLASGTEGAMITLRGAEATPGFWRGILIRADDEISELRRVHILHAGSEPFAGFDHPAAISVANDARLTLTHALIEDDDAYAVNLQPRASLPGFAENLLAEDHAPCMRIPDKQMGALDAPTEFDVVDVYPTIGGLDEGMTIANLRSDAASTSDFQMHGVFEVNAPVTIEAGVTLDFSEGGGLRVNDGGALYAMGTEETSIYIQGRFPDPGWWRGILFRAEDLESELRHTFVRNGGREAWAGALEPANITVEQGAALSTTECWIQFSAAWGVWLDSSEVVFTEDNNHYAENPSGDVGARD